MIDSGTTMYPVFQEITKKIHENRKLWQGKACIVTNNIPGIQYLMKYGKENPMDNYSEIIIDCYLIPGKPLSVYAAITGPQSIEWLESSFGKFLEDWAGKNNGVKIINFLTGNYVSRNLSNNNLKFNPVARGQGHVEIKNQMVAKSDIIFFLSPLMKFSFADVRLLNHVNKFTIDRLDIENAQKYPRMVKYEEITIPNNKDMKFFLTRRVKDCIFYSFGENLCNDLTQIYGMNNIFIPEIDIKNWIPNVKENSHLELEREIPHENLRKVYTPGENIWNLRWVMNHQIDDCSVSSNSPPGMAHLPKAGAYSFGLKKHTPYR